jgi:hypothetical protein
MAIENYVVVSGLSGVHKLVAPRSNGVIILDSAQGKNRFVPAKSTDVTPLGMISVYTETEEGAIALKEVFSRIHTQVETFLVPHHDASSTVLRAYFSSVIPEHDEYQVRIADIKKIVKWYNYMVEKNIIDEVLAEAKTEGEDTSEITEA